MLISSAINAKEGRDVVDHLDVFLHAENDKEVVMMMQGPLVELIDSTAPQIYRKYI